jgi:hypothetical protein
MLPLPLKRQTATFTTSEVRFVTAKAEVDVFLAVSAMSKAEHG